MGASTENNDDMNNRTDAINLLFDHMGEKLDSAAGNLFAFASTRSHEFQVIFPLDVLMGFLSEN